MTVIVRKDALTISNLEPFSNLYGMLYNDAVYDHRLIFNLDETSVIFTDKYRAKIISKESNPPLVLGRSDLDTKLHPGILYCSNCLIRQLQGF